MQARLGRVAAVLVAAGAVVVTIAIPAASGADSSGSLRGLRAQSDVLAGRAHSALLELYALESRLASAGAELTDVRGRAAAVARERESVRQQLRIATRTLDAAQLSLGERVRALYEQGETDPLALVLGSDSLGEAITRLDGLEVLARHDGAILDHTRAARRELRRISTRLTARSSQLRQLEGRAAAAARALGAARSARLAHLERLKAEHRLTLARISALEREARAAGELSAQLVAAPTPASPPSGRTAAETAPAADAAVAGVRKLTVLATGYAIRGRTATGIPTGWGVIAVDPSVIPLGTRVTIPGYGEGVAADVGSGVRGAMIDLWFPSLSAARAWGRRTVTIVLH